MADNAVLGRFLWHDLLTTDPRGAVAFYKKVVGWKTQVWDQDSKYTMWVADSGPIGGIGVLTQGQRAAGAKPHWLAFIGTEDIQATIDVTTSLGGLVVVNATEIANGGRYAVLADPQGALFGIYASSHATAPSSPPKRGEISWHELAAADYTKAFEFYQKLFGWRRIGEHDMGAMGVYLVFGLDGVQFGGMFNKPGGPAAWLNYALVDDAQAAAKATQAAGGEIRHGPAEVPGGGWIAQIVDPQGAAFAVHAAPQAVPTKRAEAPATSTKAAAARTKPAKTETRTKRRPAKKAVKKAAKKAPSKAAKRPASKTAAQSRPAAKKKRSSKKSAKKVMRRAVAKKKSAKRPVRKAARRRR